MLKYIKPFKDAEYKYDTSLLTKTCEHLKLIAKCETAALTKPSTL
jgi:hypothetical protein